MLFFCLVVLSGKRTVRLSESLFAVRWYLRNIMLNWSFSVVKQNLWIASSFAHNFSPKLFIFRSFFLLMVKLSSNINVIRKVVQNYKYIFSYSFVSFSSRLMSRRKKMNIWVNSHRRRKTVHRERCLTLSKLEIKVSPVLLYYPIVC